MYLEPQSTGISRRHILQMTGAGATAMLAASSASASAASSGSWDKVFPKSERVDHRKVKPASQDHVLERLRHLLWKVEAGVLPPCRIVGLADPAEPIADAVKRAGAGDTDLEPSR